MSGEMSMHTDTKGESPRADELIRDNPSPGGAFSDT
jgi:hypothetical protein